MAETTRSGRPLAYLDNAATTQKPKKVLDAIRDHYVHDHANIHRGIYDRATRATDAYEGARKKVSRFLNTRNPSEVIFTRGTTESINLVAQAFERTQLQAGDEVLITGMEHHANLIPWQMACERTGAKLQVIPVHDNGELDMEAATSLLSANTRMLALVHISNTLGTINPIQDLIAMARAKGIAVLIDAAQSIMTEAIDVQALDCDFLVFSGHKLFAPSGIGVLYGKAEWLEKLPPYQTGGSMIRSVTFEQTTFARAPQKFEAGTPNIAGAVGLGAALDFVQEIGKGPIKSYVNDLTTYALERLTEINATLIGTPTQRSAIISFLLDAIHPHDLATILNESGVAIRAGHHCTQPLMRSFQIPGTVRASFSIYNTREEIDLMIDGLTSARQLFS